MFDCTVSAVLPHPTGRLLDGLGISAERGEIIAVLGPSGCGKSTLLLGLAGLSPFTTREGDCGSGRTFSLALQQPELPEWLAARDGVAYEASIAGVAAALPPASLLCLVGLTDADTLVPAQMSSGMRQRLQLARALARPSELAFMDEPLSAVDQHLKLEIAGRAREIFREAQSTVVWVTHDPHEAARLADRILVVGGKPLRILSEIPVHDHGHKQGPSGGQSPQTLPDRLRVEVGKAYSAFSTPPTNPQLEDDEGRPFNASVWVRVLLVLLPALALITCWHFSTKLWPDLAFFVGEPLDVTNVLISDLIPVLLPHLSITLLEAFSGLAIALPAGILAGFFSGLSALGYSATRPYLVGLTGVPLFVLAPAFILWFGVGISMKIAIAALSSFPFVAYLVQDAVRSSHNVYRRYLSHIASRKLAVWLQYDAPRTLEAIIRSIRPSLVAALIGAFLGEFIAADRGLGYFIILEAARYHVAEVFAGVILLFGVTIAADRGAEALVARRYHLLRALSNRR